METYWQWIEVLTESSGQADLPSQPLTQAWVMVQVMGGLYGSLRGLVGRLSFIILQPPDRPLGNSMSWFGIGMIQLESFINPNNLEKGLPPSPPCQWALSAGPEESQPWMLRFLLFWLSQLHSSVPSMSFLMFVSSTWFFDADGEGVLEAAEGVSLVRSSI